jgi:murein DD-endopeptidase MepM/ murein hydrolase activator NlpD
MPRSRRAIVAGAWLAAASFALGTPLRALADDPAPLPAPAPAPAPAGSSSVPPPTVTPPQASTTTTTTTTTTTSTTASEGATQADLAALIPAPAAEPGCVVAAGVEIDFPHRPSAVVGAADAAPPARPVAQSALAFPADGSVVSAGSGDLYAACATVTAARGAVRLQSLSLFGGVVTAVSATVTVGGGSGEPTASTTGLHVGGRPATLAPGARIRLGDWGYLVAPPAIATGTPAAAAPEREAAFSVQLTAPYDGLPAGATVLVAFGEFRPKPQPAPPPQPTPAATPTTTTTTTTTAAAPRPTRSKRSKTPAASKPRAPHTHARAPSPAAAGQPLTVTPPLLGGPYTFPVAGTAYFGDTYGAARSDVPGGWHHGDDIFEKLGTPVVAVADGTLNRVGWERIGGWRLWVRDRVGDEFYYAHLSGYSKLALHSTHVKAGEVIGFIGNTGDAFTTVPHLHFEVHPRRLLHLGYNGAVDPTRYLNSWRRVRSVVAGRPFHPPLPTEVAWRVEAVTNFRELLDARGLDRPRAHRHTHASRPAPKLAAAARLIPTPFLPRLPVAAAASGRTGSWPWAWLGVALVAVSLLGLIAWRRLRRPRSTPAE